MKNEIKIRMKKSEMKEPSKIIFQWWNVRVYYTRYLRTTYQMVTQCHYAKPIYRET